MQKVMKRLIPLALAVMMALTCLAGCKKTDKDTEIILTTPFEENEVFRIENESCFLPEVMVYMRTAQDKYEGLFGPEIWDKDLGDITLAEPGALIGFAGPRVIEQTIGETLPEGFQSAEFQEEKGFVDRITTRQEMREVLGRLLRIHSRR